ncbi:hypothetical protein JOL79_08770 [Microbispora sp. RL4-1S]|uniref:Uncharacterized protein n=1 Tax=Microbispora oryzae TaxID=2806554 RepID=A0A940WFR4_9ACTN|nr:hypothetical protein [Microbispora oryzae]MBP2703898.1 hypothetical protein [Microbispora oryzae]
MIAIPMMSSRGSLLLTSSGSTTILVTVIILGLLVLPASGCGVPERHKVAMPPANASPEQVLRTYFDAIVGQDKETARALQASDTNFDLELERPDSPFRAWTSATDLHVEGPYQDLDCSPGATCVRMSVTFHLQDCFFATWPGGLKGDSFGLQLVKGRWLIKGHGEG